MGNNNFYKCRVCGSNRLEKTFYPDIFFNNKLFKYYKCKECNSYNVFPSPNADDFKKIYGENDHFYLKKIKKIKYNYNYSFAHHQAYQINFLKKIKHDLKNKFLLDYGCGSGFYVNYANQLGAKAVGVEFDDKFVNLLREKTNGIEVFTFEEFKENFVNSYTFL